MHLLIDFAPFIQYIRNQWISGDVFTVHDMSVFQITIRTNNDVEGNHYRINAKARKYTFINNMNIESICIYIYNLFIYFQLLWNFIYYAIYLKQKLIK